MGGAPSLPTSPLAAASPLGGAFREGGPAARHWSGDRPVVPSLREPRGVVRVVVLAIDYLATDCALSSTVDASNVRALLEACGIEDISVLFNEQCTVEAVLATLKRVGSRCRPEDCFVVYFSGHGTSASSTGAREADGQSESFVLTRPDGTFDVPGSCLRDQDFADALLSSMPQATSVLIMADSCHSNGIVDLSRACWAGRQAVSIAGCVDSLNAGDMRRGGVMTHSMFVAVDHLQENGQHDYSMGALYQAVVREGNRLFGGAQAIMMRSSRDAKPFRMLWPLQPKASYAAPLRNLYATIAPHGGITTPAALMHACSPQLLQRAGVPKQLLSHIVPGAIPCVAHSGDGASSLVPSFLHNIVCAAAKGPSLAPPGPPLAPPCSPLGPAGPLPGATAQLSPRQHLVPGAPGLVMHRGHHPCPGPTHPLQGPLPRHVVGAAPTPCRGRPQAAVAKDVFAKEAGSLLGAFERQWQQQAPGAASLPSGLPSAPAWLGEALGLGKGVQKLRHRLVEEAARPPLGNCLPGSPRAPSLPVSPSVGAAGPSAVGAAAAGLSRPLSVGMFAVGCLSGGGGPSATAMEAEDLADALKGLCDRHGARGVAESLAKIVGSDVMRIAAAHSNGTSPTSISEKEVSF